MSTMRLSEDGDMRAPARWLDGVDQIIQRISIRLRTNRGEHPEVEDFGLPHERWIVSPSQATPAIVASAVRAQLQQDPAVISIGAITFTRSGTEITLTMAFTVSEAGITTTLSLTTSPLLRVGAPALFMVSRSSVVP